MIPVYKPFLNEKNCKFAHEAINSGWISSQGKYLDVVKSELQNSFNFQKVILTNNGTTATHLLAIALKYKYPQIKKIIVPNNVYVAAWNSFLFDRYYELIPVDCDLDTWNFDLKKLQNIVDNETAILVVHNIGNIINVPELKSKFPNTVILEDNCEGFTGKYSNKFSGSDSFASSISFFGNKTLTSGEGGAFITNDEDTFLYINKVKSQGQSEEKFIHDVLGYNYRMTNVQAAILYGQLLDLRTIKELKHNVFENYKNNLKNVENIFFQRIEPDTEHSEWMFGVRINNFTKLDKKNLELHLYKSGIETRPIFYPINKHSHLSNIESEIKNAEILESQCIILPSFPELTKNQISLICDKIKFYLNK